MSKNADGFETIEIHEGKFTRDDDQGSRAFLGTGIPEDTRPIELSSRFGVSFLLHSNSLPPHRSHMFLSPRMWAFLVRHFHVTDSCVQRAVYASGHGVDVTFLTRGIVGFAYRDIRDAKHAAETIRRENPDWEVQLMTPTQYLTQFQGSTEEVSDYDGQIDIHVFRDDVDNGSAPPIKEVVSMLKDTLMTFGPIKAFHSVNDPSEDPEVMHFRIEYFDLNHAEVAVQRLQMAQHGVSCHLPF